MDFSAEAEKQTDSDFMLFFTGSPAKRKPEKHLMLKSKVPPSLKTYLFFAVVSLSASAGCGLDIDFGGGGGGGNVESRETVRGSVREVIPSVEDGVSGLFVRFTNDDGNQETYSDSTDSGGKFSVNGNLDPGGKLEILENEDSDSVLGSISLNIFPGAEVNIGDVRLRSGVAELTEDVRIIFEGTVTDVSCSGASGTLEVEIEGREREVLVQVSSSTDFDIRDNDSLECDSIIEDDQVEIRGVLLQGDTVRATDIIID